MDALLPLLEYAKAFGTPGALFLLAAGMFLLYRSESRQHAKALTAHIRDQKERIDRQDARETALLTVITDNTKAMTAVQQTTSALQATVEHLRTDLNINAQLLARVSGQLGSGQ